jgi:hypothetical protein
MLTHFIGFSLLLASSRQTDRECKDLANGERTECVSRQVLVPPKELAKMLRAEATVQKASFVFLASNANNDEVALLKEHLGEVPPAIITA